MAHYGKKLAIVQGEYCNIKITTQDDFLTACALMPPCEALCKNT
jgi:2-C-methyl-D-erythritol 4-phosphate cytidylyltransferase